MKQSNNLVVDVSEKKDVRFNYISDYLKIVYLLILRIINIIIGCQTQIIRADVEIN